MFYPANLIKADGKVLVTFDDVPEAITFGKNRVDALLHAQDALDTALTFYIERGVRIPLPSKPKSGQVLVLSTIGPI
jgi:antitoxin HicB